MYYNTTLAHDVRRLVATATTDALVLYVMREVAESYARGYANGCLRWQHVTMRSLLWRSVRRGTRRAIRRLARRLR
jgi:hypothetical protein